MFQRAENLTSNNDARENECQYVTNILKENNYRKSFLYDCLRRPTWTDCNSPEGDSAVKGFAIVPYIQGIAEPIRRILNNFGIKVALKPFQTLGLIFAKPKDRVPTDQKTHAVYSIPCGDCEKVYLGQTKRQFCTRLKEHQRAVSNFNSSKSALAEHVCETSHNIAWEDSRIITTNNRYGQRLCLKAWHINASPCALNRDDGSHLPLYHKNIYILLVDDVTLTAYKVVSFNIRPPLTKTLDRSVETLGRECNLCSVISFI